MNVSTRSSSLPVPATRKLTPYANIAKEKGVKIFRLNIGDPDLHAPEVMLDVLRNWPSGPIRYSATTGEADLISALLIYYAKLGFNFLEKQNIAISIGGSEALSMFFYCACAPGDEVLTFEPFYSNYATLAYINGVQLKAVPTSIDNGFHLPDKQTIEKYITPKTKAILYCSPGNPTGTVFTRDEVKMLVEIAKEHDLWLASDEVYREFNFSGIKHTSLLEFMQENPDKLVQLDSLSKRYSLCGARLGIIVTLNMELMGSLTKHATSRLSGDYIGQVMAAKLNEVPAQYHIDLQAEYKARRDYVYKRLKEIPGTTVSLPEGAFYIMAGLPVENAEKFCIWMLEHFTDNNETVMLAPGAGFYQTPGVGLDEVRIAYVLNLKDLERSMDIIVKALGAYKLTK